MQGLVDPVNSVYASNVPKAEEKRKGRQHHSCMDSKQAPIHIRTRLSENYDAPVSDREAWWRKDIRETPAPGSYEPTTFIQEISGRTNTYRFKTDGRRRDPQPQIGRGAYLLPGAYNHQDITHTLDQQQQTYRFKDSGRDQRDFMNFGKKDKDINVCPGRYEAHKYQNMSVEKQPSKHMVFRSQSQRFPTIHFKPKEGPGPGNYESSLIPGAQNISISSIFKSKTPRFSSSHTKVPGPGSYDKIFFPSWISQEVKN